MVTASATPGGAARIDGRDGGDVMKNGADRGWCRARGLTLAAACCQGDDRQVQAGERGGREIVRSKANPERPRAPRGGPCPGPAIAVRHAGSRTTGGTEVADGPSSPSTFEPAISSMASAARTTANASVTCGSVTTRVRARFDEGRRSKEAIRVTVRGARPASRPHEGESAYPYGGTTAVFSGQFSATSGSRPRHRLSEDVG